jgi:curved DNA-binding protein CbpA
VYDAFKVLGINESPVTEEIVKKAFRQACKKFHPDINPAGKEMMILVNKAKETLKDASYPIEFKIDECYNYGDEINEALNKIINLQGLIVEVCGAWVWVSGNTKEHWNILKGSGFKFSAPKKMVYFRPNYASARRYRKDGLAMDEIRNKYGTDNIKTKRTYFLSAHS